MPTELLTEHATTILITALGGIAVYFCTVYIKRRKLFVVVPKSFSYTGLTDKGSAHMLSLYNRGVKTEERVMIQLIKEREYSLLATTDRNIKLQDDNLSVDRINPNEELNIVLLVEGGEFSHDSIVKISSNACKGRVINSPEEVPLSFTSLIGSGLLVLFFFIGLPLIGAYFGYQFGKDRSEGYVSHLLSKDTPDNLVALDWSGMNEFVKSKYYLEDETREFPIKIIETKDLKHAALVVFKFENEGTERLEFTSYLRSVADEPYGPTVKFGEHFKHSVLVFPNEARQVSLKVNKPDSIKNKTVILDINFKYKGDSTYNLEKTFWVE